jgi:hypothetical protein
MFNLMILAGNGAVQKLSDFIDKYLNAPLKILAVVIFFVMTTIEYAQVVFSGDASPKKANEKTLKRFLALLLLFLAPDIIKLVLKIVDL